MNPAPQKIPTPRRQYPQAGRVLPEPNNPPLRVGAPIVVQVLPSTEAVNCLVQTLNLLVLPIMSISVGRCSICCGVSLFDWSLDVAKKGRAIMATK